MEAYTTINGEMIRVASVGYAFDSEVLAAVLSSMRYDPTGEPESSETKVP